VHDLLLTVLAIVIILIVLGRIKESVEICAKKIGDTVIACIIVCRMLIIVWTVCLYVA